MLNRLECFYRAQGILATTFTCSSEAACSKGCKDTFNGPKSAAVSTGYEAGDLPRLLFISQDRCPNVLHPDKRLPLAVRERMENENVCDLQRNRHWYLTHELAWYILRQFDDELELKKVNHYFAHTNAAKCCQNKPDRSQTDAILFANCQRYLAGEISVLRPDIIVTQGYRARDGLKPILEDIQAVDEFAYTACLDDRLIFWLHTYHPSPFNRWRFYPQRGYDRDTDRCEGWQRYAVQIREYVYRNRSDH